MKKTAVIVLLFILLTSGIAFGEEAKNNLAIIGANFSGIIFPNLSLGYERILTDNFTLYSGIGTNIILIPYAEIQGRWYPRAQSFFTGLGLGIFGFNTPTIFPPPLPIAPMVSLSIGWKNNVGKSGNWVLIPAFTARIIMDVYDINSIHIEHGVPELSLKIGRKF